jgi:hypothetical protein
MHCKTVLATFYRNWAVLPQRLFLPAWWLNPASQGGTIARHCRVSSSDRMVLVCQYALTCVLQGQTPKGPGRLLVTQARLIIKSSW